ncbi:MAG: Crp/Fnr family transcriptional regulator [Candidatus Kapabacteria bacterium]|jgi:CRP/FNR family transcriptional regulator|nr:Crp/Fnr family transcriptional regulator [Candidatus Kapabacteria bacterium]
MQEPSSLFHFLNDVETTLLSVPRGTWMFREDEGCGRLGFVESGVIRVFKDDPGGRQITLYRVGAGDSCILSLSCALTNPIHQASAIVEDDAVIRTITTDTFRRLMDTSSALREYVFGLFSKRLSDVMILVEEVVFHHMDSRLAGLLLEMATRNHSDVIIATHERLAEELGTVREVVTRILRDYAAKGWIQSGRGSITLLDRFALAQAVRM